MKRKLSLEKGNTTEAGRAHSRSAQAILGSGVDVI